MLADHARAMHRVCFDAEPSEADLAFLGSRERWLVYRDLVRTRLVGVVDAALPRTKAAMGEEGLIRLINDWMSSGGPTTRYFRHVPSELVAFGLPILREHAKPWLADLARYEVTHWNVRHAPPNPVPDAELTFDAPPVVGRAVSLLRLDHPAHESPTPDAGYAREPVILCLHRNDEHRVVPQTLNPLAADLLEAWQRGDATVAESVERVAASHGVEIGPAFVEKLSAFIADFITKGILLGGKSSGAQ